MKERHVDERVELAYTLTAEDFREAMAAQARHTTIGRVARLVPYGIVAFDALGLAAKASYGDAGASDVVLLAALLALALFLPRFQVLRASRRAAARGERRVVVDGSGVDVTDGQSSRTYDWQAVPRLLETPRLFVVLNRSGNCFVLLPKRGTEDPARLRALLERHTTGRATPAPTPA